LVLPESMQDQAQTRLLTEGARCLGLELSDEALTRLSVYLEEIRRWSKVADLVSQADPESVIRKHIIDSLAVSPLIPSAGRVLDLGSGAGFPGLVLAVMESSRDIVLIEARRKRANFLKEVARRMKVVNVRVYEGRAEQLASEGFLRASFGVVLTRATWSLKEFLGLARSFLAAGGIALAMKGPQVGKELIGLETYPQILGFSLQRRYEYSLPFGNEKRQAIIFAKECFT